MVDLWLRISEIPPKFLNSGFGMTLGFQRPCEEIFGPQKPTQKTFSAGIWKTRVIVICPDFCMCWGCFISSVLNLCCPFFCCCTVRGRWVYDCVTRSFQIAINLFNGPAVYVSYILGHRVVSKMRVCEFSMPATLCKNKEYPPWN